jgi:hypothetical protein
MTENKQLIPPTGDLDLGKKIFSLVEAGIGKKEKRGLHDKWIKSYKQLRNRFFKQASTVARPLLAANLTQKHVRDTVARLTRGQPTYNVMPVGATMNGAEELCEKAHRLTQYKWNEREFQRVYRSAVNDGETYGCVISKVVFDPRIEWEGDADWKLIDPFRFVPYPDNVINIQEAKCIFEIASVDINTLREQYPDLAEKIKPDDDILQEADDERSDPSMTQTTLGSVTSKIASVYDTEDSDEEKCTVIEAWVRDFTMKPAETSIDEQTGEIVEIPETPMYPGGIRMIRVCNGGELILEDSPNPSINPGIPTELTANTYLFDKFPYIRTPSISDSFDPYGRGDLENTMELQEQINLCLSMMIKERNESSTKLIKVSKDSGVPIEAVRIATTSRVAPHTAMAGQGVSMESLGEYNQIYAEMFTLLSDLFKKITGVDGVDPAQAGGGSLQYKALAMMKEEVDEFSREKYENYSLMLRDVGRMLFSLYQNFYTEKRWYEYEEEGEVKQDSIDMIGEDYKYLRFPVRLSVVRGSSMPDSAVQRREQAIELYQAEAFGPTGSSKAVKALLKELEWDGWSDIVKALEEDEMQPMIEALKAAGVPEQLTEYFQQIMSQPPDAVQAAVQGGEMQSFQAVINALLQGQEELPLPPVEQMLQLEIEAKQISNESDVMDNEFKKTFVAPEREAEIKKMQAETQKVLAEIEKISSDVSMNKTREYVANAGVMFDEEMLKIMRARETINARIEGMRLRMAAMQMGMQNAQKAVGVPKVGQLPGGAGGKPARSPGGDPYSENVGIRSNNVRLKN